MFMKKLFVILMLTALSLCAFAQQTESTEKIVTSKFSLLMGSSSIADHYFTRTFLASISIMSSCNHSKILPLSKGGTRQTT